jgi:hypothetical protein
LNDVSQITQPYKTIQSRSKTPSKINIENVYINKKVQIGKNFSKLKIAQNSISKPSSPLIPSNNYRKINRKIFSHHNSKNYNQSILNNTSFSNKIKIIKKNKFSNELINHTIENSEKKEKSKRKLKELRDNRKLSVMDIPSFSNDNYQNNVEKSHKDNFCLILAKSNIIPIKLRLIFALKSKFYSKEEILKDYQKLISLNSSNYLFYEREFKYFNPSKTIQCFLGFINKEKEIEFVKNHCKYNLNNENDVIIFNMFKILYILLNKEISSNDNDLIKDFFGKIFEELKVNDLKSCILNIICPNFTVSRVQLNTINMILRNFPKIVDNNYYKSLENDQISFTISLFIKEIYIYSKKQFSNGKKMIMYINEKKELNLNNLSNKKYN